MRKKILAAYELDFHHEHCFKIFSACARIVCTLPIVQLEALSRNARRVIAQLAVSYLHAAR